MRPSTFDRGSINRPHYILLPVSSGFIAVSLIGALLLNLLPTGNYWGVPDWVALVVVFWNIHQPRKVGIGIAFAMGIAMDINDAALLGEHALAYTLLGYGAITLHRRVLWFGMTGQMAHVLPLLLAAQIATYAVRIFSGAAPPGFMALLQSVVATALWPLITLLLLAPQRRSIDRDENRPI